jgi:hypothetical protein
MSPAAPTILPSNAAEPSGTPFLAGDPMLGNAALGNEAEVAERYDLPPGARRSLAQIGPLRPEQGGFAPDAFGVAPGDYLAALLRHSRAPYVSRWASIAMRRALMSSTRTPSGISGADWVAERAWLLLRMGEADAARLLVQAVDSDQFTSRLYAVAMQAQLATADPAGLCPLLPRASGFSEEPAWFMAEAICASFAADQGTASAILGRAERQGIARGIDYRLAEKVVGSGPSSRRSVKIEWDGVTRLDAWRFGLATATNVEVPPALFETVGRQVRAWEARAPMLSPVRRAAGVAEATRLGVFSGDAALDFYAQLSIEPDVAVVWRDVGDLLRTGYAAPKASDRVAALRDWWSRAPALADSADPSGVDYAWLPPVARAAAAVPAADSYGEDVPALLAAMLAGGYDRSAARWGSVVNGMNGVAGNRAWALLAVGAPSPVVELTEGRINSFVGADDSESGQRGRMLVAALAGLERLRTEERASVLENNGLITAPRTPWARAIMAAAARREPATVTALVAVGLQGAGWASVPAEHLYFITAALRRVGLDPVARMIAAEAMART